MSGAPGEGGMLHATSSEVGDEDTYSVRRRAGDNIHVADTTKCVYTSARCEGGDGGDGEVVKVTEGDQSLCPALLTACSGLSEVTMIFPSTW